MANKADSDSDSDVMPDSGACTFQVNNHSVLEGGQAVSAKGPGTFHSTFSVVLISFTPSATVKKRFHTFNPSMCKQLLISVLPAFR